MSTVRRPLRLLPDGQGVQEMRDDEVLPQAIVPAVAREVEERTGDTYTLVLEDMGRYLRLTHAAGVLLTIPPNSEVAFPVGAHVSCEQSGAGQVDVQGGAGVTLLSLGGANLSSGQHGVWHLVKVAADTWTAYGDLTDGGYGG